ncbi:MAG TPA: outer membrane beta-barrel protein [Candidatus Krumholzibacteria bacterium]|nr:outer membrane beta-barrel protein [Candidatus Krumholzibacteria bacterium]
MLKKIMVVCVAALSIAGVEPVAAQGVGVGPHVGYYRNKGADSGDLLFGAAMRARFLTILGVEASLDYRQDELADESLTARSWPIQVTGLVYPLTVLYLGVGAGWYRTTYDFELPGVENQTTKDFGWHLGTGLEIPLGEVVSLTGDVRWVYLNASFADLPEEAQRDNDFYVMSAGLLFGL